MEIESPFPNEVESFNNTESYPDLVFVVPGMDGSLSLHKKILAKASTMVKEMLKKQESVEALVNRAVEAKLCAVLKGQVTLNHKAVSAEEFNKMFE